MTTASATEALDPSDRQPEFPGWYLPKENIPEGWAKTPQDDSAYVVATEGKDLEHVGSEKWLELQFDDKPNYKGYEADAFKIIQSHADTLQMVKGEEGQWTESQGRWSASHRSCKESWPWRGTSAAAGTRGPGLRSQ